MYRMRTGVRPKRVSLILFIAISNASAKLSHATIQIWSGSATSSLTTGENISWAYSSNWHSAPNPAGGDNLVFPAPNPTSNPVIHNYFGEQGLDGSYSIENIADQSTGLTSFQAATASGSSASNVLTLTGLGTNPLLEITVKPTTGLFGIGDLFSNTGSSHGELTLNLATVGAFKVDDSTTTLTIAGPVTGTSGGILDQGAGTIVFNNLTTDPSTFGGGLELDGGAVAVSGNSGSGSGPIGTGTLTVTLGTSSFSALTSTAVTLNNAIAINNQFNVGTTTTGNLTFSGNVALGTATRRTIVVSNSTTILTGTISGSSGLRSMGAGTLRIEGPTTYTGLTEEAGGALSLGSNNGSGLLTQSMGGLQIDSGLTTTVLFNPTHANRTVVVTGGLTLAGTTGAWTSSLDLSANDMLVHNGSLSQITNQVAKGYNAGAWTGNGIRSSGAAADTNHYRAIGVIQNSLDGTTTGTTMFGNTSNSNSSTYTYAFDGQRPLSSTDVLLKYTWAGDTNFDEKVDGTDYSRVDNGKLFGLTGWYNGDFNYDGVVNANDYTIIDNTYAYTNISGGRIFTPAALLSLSTGPLSVLEQLWHWKLPGYAAYYLPIYEANFGQLSDSEYDQALADGTPADGTAPAYFAPSAALFPGSSPFAQIDSSSVPEPSALTAIIASGALMLGRRRLRKAAGV